MTTDAALLFSSNRRFRSSRRGSIYLLRMVDAISRKFVPRS